MKRGLLLAALCRSLPYWPARPIHRPRIRLRPGYTEPLDAGTLKAISTLPRKLAGAMRAVAGGRVRPQLTLLIGSVRYCKSYLMVLAPALRRRAPVCQIDPGEIV